MMQISREQDVRRHAAACATSLACWALSAVIGSVRAPWRRLRPASAAPSPDRIFKAIAQHHLRQGDGLRLHGADIAAVATRRIGDARQIDRAQQAALVGDRSRRIASIERAAAKKWRVGGRRRVLPLFVALFLVFMVSTEASAASRASVIGVDGNEAVEDDGAAFGECREATEEAVAEDSEGEDSGGAEETPPESEDLGRDCANEEPVDPNADYN